MNARAVLVALAALLVAAVPVNAALKEGDPAPPMTVKKWVKGAPVTRFAKGHVYVVEFWATWCGPCREAMPHLTSLARKYKGTVSVASINMGEQEKGAARVAKVTKFVRDMGGKMGYSVGMDGDSGPMTKAWMAASGQKGIPVAYVIDKRGRIAWIGFPMQLDKVLPPIIKGTFNVQSAARTRIATDALYARMIKAIQANDDRTVVADIDKYLASHPEMENIVGVNKYMSLLQYDAPAAMKYAERLANLCKDDAMLLNDMAYMALEEKIGLRVQDYPIILAMATRANALRAGQDSNVLDTLAAVYARNGDMATALATQDRAVARMDKNTPSDLRQEVMKHLAEYKAKMPR